MKQARTRLFFLSLFTFSLYHLVRDLLQEYHVENTLTDFLKLSRNWCGWYCNAITIPFELLIMLGSLLVLKRGRVGLFGYLSISLFLIWLGMFLYDYFVFNR